MLSYTPKAKVGGDAQLLGMRRDLVAQDLAKSDLDSSTHAIFFLNDKDSAMSIANVSHGECQWSVRSTFCSCPCVHAVIH